MNDSNDSNPGLQLLADAPPMTNKGTAENKSTHPLFPIVEGYLNSMRNISETIQIVMPHLAKWLSDEIKKNQRKLSQYIQESGREGDIQQVYLDSARSLADFINITRRGEELITNRAVSVLGRSLFMQMFCEFDALTGNLLKTVYLRNPILLKGITREISLTDLVNYEDIDSVKRAILDKEIETFRRDSYIEQFSQLEKKFGLSLRKFKEWGEFVELSQRRNILTHNDGIVNEQYLMMCDKEGFSFESRPKVGDRLDVDGKYFGKAHMLITKVGYMLCHTLWSKVFPSESDDVHKSLNDSLYNCLISKRWRLAAAIGEFSLTEPMRKGITELSHRIRLINVAIGLKFSGSEDQAKKLLSSQDWSASYRDFKLALHILNDQFVDAAKLMKEIGKSGEIIQQEAYHIWPLFYKFRERPEFYEIYEKIYGEPYLEDVSANGKIQKVEVGASSNLNAATNQPSSAAVEKLAKKARKKMKSRESIGSDTID